MRWHYGRGWRQPHASVSAQRRRREGRSGAAGSVLLFRGCQVQRGGDGASRSPEASAARRPAGPKASAERSEGTMEALRGETH